MGVGDVGMDAVRCFSAVPTPGGSGTPRSSVITLTGPAEDTVATPTPTRSGPKGL